MVVRHTTQAPQPMAKRIDWRFIKKHISDGTTPLDIKSGKVRSGWKRTVMRVMVEGDYAKFTKTRIGYIDQFDSVGWYAEQKTLWKGGLHGMNGPVVLQAGDRLLVRVTEALDGNHLDVYAYGYDEEVELNQVDWRFIKKHISNGTTPLDIKSGKVRSGWKRTVMRVAIENETTEFTELKIGYIDDRGVIGWYNEREISRVGVLYWMTGPVVLQVGDRLLTRFFGSGNGDNLSIYAYGFEEEN